MRTLMDTVAVEPGAAGHDGEPRAGGSERAEVTRA